MKRIDLRERLSKVSPEQTGFPQILDSMTLRTYLNLIKFLVPERKDVLYRLIRSSNVLVHSNGGDKNITLAEALCKVYESGSSVADDIAFDLIVRPFDALERKEKP